MHDPCIPTTYRPTMMIRPARADEATVLRDIEVASGALFAEIGMDDIAASEPMWIEEWERFYATGLAWVAEEDDVAVGFALAEVLDGALHLEQLSVHPSFGRRGIGAALVEHVCGHARRAGFDAVTLSTFRDVAFNGPFYAGLGFTALTDDQLTGGLRARAKEEAAHGLDPATRVMMRRAV